MCRIYWFCALFLFLQQQLKAQFHLERPFKKEALPFSAVKNMIVVPLMINGKGPFNFILDTGVGIFLITNPLLIDTLGITHPKEIKVTGFGAGNDLTAFISPPLNIRIGNRIFGKAPAAVLKQDAFSLSSYAGMPIDGLLGFEFFNSFIVKIAYSTNTLKVYSPEVPYIPKRGMKVPISVEEGKPYVYADVFLEPDRPVRTKLIIDSGAGHPLSLESIDGQPFQMPEKRIEANLGVGLTGAINGFMSRIPAMTIGKYTLANVLVAFPDYSSVTAKVSSVSRNGNIGNSILKRFDIVLDYSRESIYLKPNYNNKQAFEHDMSGLELAAIGPGYKTIVITRVEPDSPAAHAGLQEDDEILAINFKPVKDMGMDEIYNILHSGRERGIALKVRAPGSEKTELIIVDLKRRI